MSSHPVSVLPQVIALCVLASATAPVDAQQTEPVDLEAVQITSTKVPLNLRDSTVTATVVSGDELRARGATDLRSALSLVAGVDVSSGGDGGPASSVPALWGLREFDAFLLVVDGVPAGGAFTPALATLNLNNVERIEVIKGAAPVSYGATSFVGVIHVVHRAAGEGNAQVEAGFGSRGGARLSLAVPLSLANDRWQQSLFLDGENNDLTAARAGWARWHALYRGATRIGEGDFTLDLDGTMLRQNPGSPHPREGRSLSTRVPLDANHNPRDARIDENRVQLALGYVLTTGLGEWSTRLAAAHSDGDIVRGFLREDFATDGATINADGYQQDREIDELYLDSHLLTRIGEHARLAWGLDHMYGKGKQHSNNFEYAVRGDGRDAPSWRDRPIDEQTRLEDERNFTGLYASLDYEITGRWRVDAGLRYNLTQESREGEVIGADESAVVAEEEQEAGKVRRNENRLSGSLGTSYRIWNDGTDYLTAYANYRDTFKPAVIDFGPEAEADLLKPEQARSVEIGLRGRNLSGRLGWDIAVFGMDFENLVVAQNLNGTPALTNAGNERFKGAEIETNWKLTDDLVVSGTWAWHDARFADYQRLFDGTPTQLDGNFLELSPQHVGSLGVRYTPEHGFHAYLTASQVGARYLDKRNRALAGGYASYDAGIGYRHHHWDLRLDGSNLGNRRDPSAESELGDAQYYLLPARTLWASVRYDFGT